MAHPVFLVDAFSAQPFGGNPAAVVLLKGPAPEAWMQSVAAELNLSETAFLHHDGDLWRLRWFTPTTEVELCGHATLACAQVLRELGLLAEEAMARFATRSGELSARAVGDALELDLPATPAEEAPPPPGLLEALGVEPRWAGRSCFDWLFVLEDASAVCAARPDFRALAACTSGGAIVTAAPGPSGHDFVSRFFAPSLGIDEDPVTGSAHCALGPFWGSRLGKREMRAFQASRRGGELGVRTEGGRVFLTGRATTVLRGELRA